MRLLAQQIIVDPAKVPIPRDFEPYAVEQAIFEAARAVKVSKAHWIYVLRLLKDSRRRPVVTGIIATRMLMNWIDLDDPIVPGGVSIAKLKALGWIGCRARIGRRARPPTAKIFRDAYGEHMGPLTFGEVHQLWLKPPWEWSGKDL